MNYKYPFGTEFDRKLLALLVQDVEFIPAYSACIQPEYFIDELDEDICKALLAAFRRGKEMPSRDSLEIELRDHIRPGREWNNYIRRLDEIFALKVSDPGWVKEKAKEFGRHRAIWKALEKGIDLVSDGVVDEAEKEIRKAFATGTREDVKSYQLRNDYSGRLDLYGLSADAQRDSNKLLVCPTGINGLDSALEGGLYSGELGVILGPPNRGKTTVLCNIGYAAVRAGLQVAHYTLELSPRDTLEKYDMRIVGMTRQEIRAGVAEAKTRLAAWLEKYKGCLDVYQYLPEELSVSFLRNDLEKRKMETGKRPDVLIIDYAGIMRPEKDTDSLYTDKGGVVLGLRSIAVEYNVPVWTAWQVNRVGSSDEVENKGMEHVAESHQLNQHADHIISLCSTIHDRSNHKMRLFGVKARRVQSEYGIWVRTDWSRSTIQEV